MSSEKNRKRRKSKGQSEIKNHNFTKLVNDKTFSPIEIGNLRKISDSAIRILSEIGMSDAQKNYAILYWSRVESYRETGYFIRLS